uniref:Uncharacterized protein n=1 Tax=Aegilops tauschii subsp. strangulata TaxID=200361 RepID=A0A453AYM3_AEGTS
LFPHINTVSFISSPISTESTRYHHRAAPRPPPPNSHSWCRHGPVPADLFGCLGRGHTPCSASTQRTTPESTARRMFQVVLSPDLLPS